jgi:hypothetical protein
MKPDVNTPSVICALAASVAPGGATLTVIVNGSRR